MENVVKSFFCKWLLVTRWFVALVILSNLLACGQDSANQTISSLELSSPKAETSVVPASPAPMFGISHLVTEEIRETYQWYCAQCHGVKGKGDGINSKYVTVPPRNHTKADYLETRSDQELFDAIRLGGLKIGRAPCMPAWGQTLDENTIWSLVNYIRELCQCEAI